MAPELINNSSPKGRREGAREGKRERRERKKKRQKTSDPVLIAVC